MINNYNNNILIRKIPLNTLKFTINKNLLRSKYLNLIKIKIVTTLIRTLGMLHHSFKILNNNKVNLYQNKINIIFLRINNSLIIRWPIKLFNRLNLQEIKYHLAFIWIVRIIKIEIILFNIKGMGYLKSPPSKKLIKKL